MLNAVVRYLYDKYAEKFPEYLDDIAELKHSTYVDNILAFGKTDEEAHKRMLLAIDAIEAGQMHVSGATLPLSLMSSVKRTDFLRRVRKLLRLLKSSVFGTTHQKMRYGQPLSICMTSVQSRICGKDIWPE